MSRDLPLLALALLLSAWAYRALLGAYFQVDDFLNLYQIVNFDPEQYVLQPHGGHLLVARNGLFLLSYHAFGLQAELFFASVLLTHLFNVALLFLVLWNLTGSDRLACFGAALWGMLPVHEGTLGWYSVYGHVVVGTTTLLVLLGLARAAAGARIPRYAAYTWPLVLLVGATSFGTGIGVAMVFWAVALLMLPAGPERRRISVALAVLVVLLPVLYVGLNHFYATAFNGEDETPLYFSGLRRGQVLAELAAGILSFAVYTVFVGPAAPVVPYGSVASYGVVAAAVTFVGAAAARGTAAVRRRMLAALLLAVGALGTVAVGLVGRAPWVPERTRFSMIQSERYQYVASLALVTVLCLALERYGPPPAASRALRNGVLATALATMLVCHVALRAPIDLHERSRQGTERAVRVMRRLIAAAPEKGPVYIRNHKFAPVGLLLVASPTMFPGWAAVFAIFFPDNVIDGKRVYFVMQDQKVAEQARRGRRASALILGPDEYTGPLVPAPLPASPSRGVAERLDPVS